MLISAESTCLALFPKTNSIASMTFDLPLPFGPTIAERDCISFGYVFNVIMPRSPYKGKEACIPCETVQCAALQHMI